MSTDSNSASEAHVKFITAARALAEQEIPIPDSIEKGIEAADRPLFPDPLVAREELWNILAQPERAKALAWLNKTGLLEELIPSWEGNASRKHLRLDAVQKVHEEIWREGMDPKVFTLVCDTHDVVVDNRLNRWALTAFATLLAGGDIEDPHTWAAFIRRDLHNLGATEAEIVWIENILLDFNPAMRHLLGDDANIVMRPELAVACLSTLAVTDAKEMPKAVNRANHALSGETNPLDDVPEEE